MDELSHIESLEQIEVLADRRRLAILRLLMAEPSTLSQIGRALGEHPAWVRHHLKRLEQAGLVEMSKVQVDGGYVEKYYQAKSHAFIFQKMILPDYKEGETIVLQCSHDLALELLGDWARRELKRVHLLIQPVGSMEGLVALRQGTSNLAGCHLLDEQSGEYNYPYVRHFFPDHSVSLITLVDREQGLILGEGNPHKIKGLDDLIREDIVLVNRNPGSGTRIWLDDHLRKLSLPTENINGYTQELSTHIQIAMAIAQGRADVGLGLRAAADRFGLDFIPLFQERYDLVVPRKQLESGYLSPLFDYLLSADFRRQVQALSGYDTTHTGNQVNV
jgi:molybdate-binding protein/DNA-binding HxlR family transcriptional regulator